MALPGALGGAVATRLRSQILAMRARIAGAEIAAKMPDAASEAIARSKERFGTMGSASSIAR